MRQAIITKWVGPTNTQGGRVIAKCRAGRHVHHWDYGLSVDANHAQAARRLVEKLGWTCKTAENYRGTWIAGGLPSQDGSCFAFMPGIAPPNLRPEDGFTV